MKDQTDRDHPSSRIRRSEPGRPLHEGQWRIGCGKSRRTAGGKEPAYASIMGGFDKT